MGCDIHLWVEVFRRGRWITAFGPKYKSERQRRKDDGAGPEWGSVEAINSDYIIPVEIPCTAKYHAIWDYPLYIGRNYDRFAVLADVRNPHDCEPIVARRDAIPEDASVNVRKEFIRWDSDGHSHSWITLQELDAFNWDTVAWSEEHRVGARRFAARKDPYTLEGQAFKTVTARHGIRVGPARIDRLNEVLGYAPNNPLVAKAELTHWHTQRVPVTYKMAAAWHDDFLPALRMLAPKGDSTKLRIVFWFDN